MVRTSLGTCSASYAGFPVYDCNAVDDSDSIVCTLGNTVAEAETSVRTCPLTSEEVLCSLACMDPVSFHDLAGHSIASCTHNCCHLGFNVSGFYTHDVCDLCSHSCSAYRTECCAQARISAQRCRVVIATCISTGTAVCSRKSFSYCCDSFVNRHIHELRCYCQDDTCNQTYDCYHYSRKYY